jgi:hypothetical protein
MPDAARDDDRLPRAQRDRALAVWLGEHEIHGAGEEVHDLLSRRVHLPGGPVGSVVSDHDETPSVQIGALRDGLPEVRPDGHLACLRAVVELDVGGGEVDGLGAGRRWRGRLARIGGRRVLGGAGGQEELL